MKPEMPQLADMDPRLTAILWSAFDAFRTYGFKRTSMEDIARGADMSRAALYLHFRNKDDIFRSLIQVYFDGALAGVEAELRPGRPVTEALKSAFAAQASEVADMLMSSPHGAELMDATHAHSGEIVRACEARITGVYADWLQGEAAAGRIDLTGIGSPDEVARTMQGALHGLKSPLTPDYRAGMARLATAFGRALTPR